MKKVLMFILSVFFIGTLSAVSICPKCKFQNEDEDRYCIECGYVMRDATEAEKTGYEVVNKNNNNPDTSVKTNTIPSRFNVELTCEFVDHSADGVRVRLTAKNRSTKPLKSLNVKVNVTYSSTRANLDWNGEGVFSLIESFDPPFAPKDTLIKEYKIYGRGTFRSENPNDCKITATVMHYTYAEEEDKGS